MARAAELVLEIAVAGAGSATRALSQVSQQVQGLTRSAGTLRQVGEGLAALGAATYAFSRVFQAFSGLGIASEFEAIRNQLTSLLGSETEAERLTSQLFEMARATRYNTAEVTAFGAALLASGSGVQSLTGELSSLLDLLAALGVRREDLQRVLENIVQIRSMEAGAIPIVDIRQMVRAMPGIGRVLGAELGMGPLTAEQIQQVANQLGGEAFFRLLLRAAARFEGASRKLAIADVLANFAESVQFALQPTGELFARILRLSLPILARLLELFGRLNRALGGVPGALLALAAAASAAAASLRILQSVGLASVFGLLASAGQALFGVLRAVGLRLALLASLFYFGANAIGALLERLGVRGAGETLGRLGTGAAVGAGIGALLGTIIPGLGNLAGALLGALIGGLVGVLTLLFGGRAPTQERQVRAQEQTARNTERMARVLEDMRIQLVGGGIQARTAATRYEIESYLRRLAAAGI